MQLAVITYSETHSLSLRIKNIGIIVHRFYEIF